MPIIKSAGVLHFGSELRGPGACLRHGRDRPRRAAPRDCDPFYRNCQFHCACGDAGAQRTRNAAQSRLERPHSACRVNFYAPTLHRVVLNFFPRGACRCREEALRIRLSACRSKQLCSVMGGKRQTGPSEGRHRTRRLFSHQCFVCGFDQRPCKPLAAFGQSCRTMSEIYEYREYPVACEVCNSDT